MFASNATSVSESLRQLARSTPNAVRRDGTETAMKLALSTAINIHPVRTGRARRAWQAALAGFGPAHGGEVTGSEQGEGTLRVRHTQMTSEAVASSRVPYAVYLEYGNRRMAPRAIVRRGLAAAAAQIGPLLVASWRTTVK